MSQVDPGDRKQLDGYRLLREIGRGGMGVVYLAEQLKLDRKVALKVMAAELSGDPGYKARFEREARLAAALDHPNVVPLFEASEVEGRLYLAMRFVDGIDLSALLAREGRLDPRRAADVTRQVGAALDAAHQKGLIHRDVKPANILLTRDEEPHVYLTDFGIAKDSAANTALTHTGEWVGTLDYVAPEQFERGLVDARADVYSLGCVFFQMLSGRVPYDGTGMQKMWSHANEVVPSLAETDTALASMFDEVIARAMAKRPEDRFLSAGDFGRAAVAAAGGEAITVPERSVATGAAASGASDSIAPTKHLASGPSTSPFSPSFVPDEGSPAPPTARLAQPGRRGWRRIRVALVVLALLAAGGIAGVIVSASGGDGGRNAEQTARADQGARTETTADETRTQAEKPEKARTSPKSEAATSSPELPPTPEPAHAPVRYAGYSPPGGGFWAEIPSGAGWSTPLETEPTAGRLFRTTVRGPGGLLLIIDHTPYEAAGFGTGYDTRRELSHPWFGSMTEYVFSGGRIPECQNSTCFDYIVNAAADGPGYGVLAGGTSDAGLAQAIARHVATSLVYEDA